MEPNYTKTSLVPLEIMWCKLSNDTKNTQNRVWQAIQPSVKILELKQKNRMKLGSVTAKPNPNDQASTMYALRAGMRLSFSLFYFNDSPQLKLHTHTHTQKTQIML